MAAPGAAPAPRLTSLDAFRGFTMLLMASEIARLPRALLQAYPDNGVAFVLADMLEHRAWVGVTPWDLIQPSFMFMVGVALPFSVAARRARGDAFGGLFRHALWRSLLLVALGIFLRSQGRPQTYFTFEDVLTQIGLGYVFLFLLAWTQPRVQWAAAAVILVAYWAAFALYPLPGSGFDWTSVGVPAGWPHHLSGFAAHWDKNVNLAHAVDVWFLNLFPRQAPFVANGGGYLTLSFIPTLGTMILGLIAGEWLRASAPAVPMRRLVLAGVAGLALGGLLHVTGLNPVVKRIWTPAWTLFSGGWCFLLLAAFSWVIEVRGYRRWAIPLVVIGLNSIAAYLIAHLLEDFIVDAFRIHLGAPIFASFGDAVEPFVRGLVVLAIYWLILFWMYRRKLFLRI
jgi:heparan-alpha-glucosaminide N-acetyltransferase